jgi:hypothetical protein
VLRIPEVRRIASCRCQHKKVRHSCKSQYFVAHFDVVDITHQLVKRWSRPVHAKNVAILRSHLQSPLEDKEKIPISQEEFDHLCVPYSPDCPLLSLSHEELSTLFRVSAIEHATGAHLKFVGAICQTPPTTGTERSFTSTWDINISLILQFTLSTVHCVRDRCNERPNYGLLLKGHCIFRGEEKGTNSSGDPK